MKMKHLNFYALLVGAIFFTAACDKDVDSTSLKVDLARTISVKGYVYANTNDTKAGFEKAPEGTEVILSVNYSDLGSTSVGKWIDTVRVDANGQFTSLVPVDDNGVTLNVDPQPFEANQIFYGSTLNDTKMKIFYAATKTFPLSTSVNEIVQVTYSDKGYSSTVAMAPLTLTIEAEYDETVIGFDVAAAQEVILSANGWAEKLSTNSDGKISTQVPANENIYITCNFQHNVKLAGGANKTMTFKKDNASIGNSSTGFINPVQIIGTSK